MEVLQQKDERAVEGRAGLRNDDWGRGGAILSINRLSNEAIDKFNGTAVTEGSRELGAIIGQRLLNGFTIESEAELLEQDGESCDFSGCAGLRNISTEGGLAYEKCWRLQSNPAMGLSREHHKRIV